MTLIYLVRHAEPAATWGAHPNPGLSELGHRQAAAASLRLEGVGAKQLITSPLARCQETAQPSAAALSFTPRIEPRVAEIPVPAHVTDHRDWLTRVMSGSWQDGHVDQGLRDWRDQIGQALVELTHDTLVFSHFVAINAAVGLATKSDTVTSFKPGHASVTILRNSGGVLTVESLGEEAPIHLT
ncbi:MAG: histidine phosphatase family protein [Alphaproteobacteria bacterium PA3]|nr:MAG: histidine phosphatase family protein [Alphaproteobacteria bacterium PA3]